MDESTESEGEQASTTRITSSDSEDTKLESEMPFEFQKLLKKKASSSGSKKRKEADPPSKISSDNVSPEPQVGKQPEKKSKRIRPPALLSSSATAPTEPPTEEPSVEMLGETRQSLPPPSKDKGKEAVPNEALAVSLASEDVKVHQPTFLYKGQPLLAKESALKSPGVAYSLLGHSILPTDEEEIHRMSENALKNQAFHSLMKVILTSPNCSYSMVFLLIFVFLVI